jgi:hypothetical protein
LLKEIYEQAVGRRARTVLGRTSRESGVSSSHEMKIDDATLAATDRTVSCCAGLRARGPPSASS